MFITRRIDARHWPVSEANGVQQPAAPRAWYCASVRKPLRCPSMPQIGPLSPIENPVHAALKNLRGGQAFAFAMPIDRRIGG
jgi:hypothetical protein